MTPQAKLFNAIIEACPDVAGWVKELHEQAPEKNPGELAPFLELNHILRTAAARGKWIAIHSDGIVAVAVNNTDPSKEDYNPDGGFKGVTILDLTKSVADQDEEVIKKLVEIIV